MNYYKSFNNLIKNKRLILFGAGYVCVETAVTMLYNYKIEYICDNNPQKWGTTYLGYTVYSPEKLKQENLDEIVVLITLSGNNANAVIAQLTEWQVPFAELSIFDFNYFEQQMHEITKKKDIPYQNEAEINKVFDLLCDDTSQHVYKKIIENYKSLEFYYGDLYDEGQYFNDILKDSMTDQEIYVDAGVFTGDTIFEFIKYTNNRYAKIYGFEAEPEMYWAAIKKFENASKDIILNNTALYCEKGTLCFDWSILPSQCTPVSETSKVLTHADKLDDLIDDKVTFIKMDIEGADYSALLGAERIIKTHKPKIAVSIYHNPEDIWRIPLLLHDMVPEYKMYVRHHSKYYYDTVLYAKI